MRILKYIAIAALAFQGFHLIEHIAQLGYWFAHPTSPPWMTPWAMTGMHLLSVGGNHALGNELLHLAGNLIFMAGLIAFACCCRAQATAAGQRPLSTATWIQGIHVVEHLALTATTVFWGKAIGVSTLLGLATGPLLFTNRIWFHFLINLVATLYTARAVAENVPALTPHRPRTLPAFNGRM